MIRLHAQILRSSAHSTNKEKRSKKREELKQKSNKENSKSREFGDLIQRKGTDLRKESHREGDRRTAGIGCRLHNRGLEEYGFGKKRPKERPLLFIVVLGLPKRP